MAKHLYLVYAFLVFLFTSSAFCQQTLVFRDNTPNPYNWNKLYGENYSQIDSAINWISKLELLFPESSIDLLINSLGKNFYRSTYAEAIELLNSKFERENVFNREVDKLNYPDSLPITYNDLKKLPSTYTYLQIWNESSVFAVNYPKGIPKPFESNLINRIELLRCTYDSSTQTKVIPDLISIREAILRLSDKKEAAETIFYLLNRLLIIEAPMYVFRRIIIDLSLISTSKEFSHYESATWLLGSAKMLASKELIEESWLVINLLRQAEGYMRLAPVRHADKLKRIRTIYSQFLMDADPGENKVLVLNSLDPIRAPGGVQFILDKTDSFSRILNIALVEVVKSNDLRERGRSVPLSLRLKILIYLNLLNHYLADNDVYKYCMSSNRAVYFFRTLYFYYASDSNYEKAIKYMLKHIYYILESKSNNYKLTIGGLILTLDQFCRSSGKYFTRKNLIKKFGHPDSQGWFEDFPTRMCDWTHEHFSKVRDEEMLYIVNLNERDWGTYKGRRYRAQIAHEFSNYCSDIGKYANAYLFLKISDSLYNLVNETNYEFLRKSINSDGVIYFPKITNDEDNIQKKQNIIVNITYGIIILSVISVAIFTALYVAVIQRKKAKRLEAKSTILAQTMRQIGHLAPQCINEIIDDHKESLGDYLYSKLEKLSGLLQRFYDYSKEEQITYRQELTLAKDFVDLSYESPRNPNPSSFIAANDKSYSEIPQPKYVLFNAIQNAYKYSRKSIFNGGVMSVIISEEGDGYRMRIVNSLDKPKTGKPKPGSGIEYMGKILVNKTKIPKSRLDYGYDQEEFYLTYTFKP